MFLPLLFKKGLRCLIVGGGQVASRKIDVLLGVPCEITVIAPVVTGRVLEIVRKGTVRWLNREYICGDCKGFQLVIAATPCRDVNHQVSKEAQELGIPINAVDDPELSTVIFPAIWQDGSLLVAVSTEGTAPFMAAGIRTLLSNHALGMGRWVEIGRKFRDAVRREITDRTERQNLYQEFLDAGPPENYGGVPDSARLSDWLLWLRGIRDMKR